MPLKKGKSSAVVSANIREMVKSGYKPKQAIAASLANARKYADGGEVDDMEDDERDMLDLQEQGKYHPDLVANPQYQAMESELAKALQKHEESEWPFMSDGGEVEIPHPDTEPDDGDDEPDSGAEHPKYFPDQAASMNEGLTEEQKQALMDKKKRRRFA